MDIAEILGALKKYIILFVGLTVFFTAGIALLLNAKVQITEIPQHDFYVSLDQNLKHSDLQQILQHTVNDFIEKKIVPQDTYFVAKSDTRVILSKNSNFKVLIYGTTKEKSEDLLETMASLFCMIKKINIEHLASPDKNTPQFLGNVSVIKSVYEEKKKNLQPEVLNAPCNKYIGYVGYNNPHEPSIAALWLRRILGSFSIALLMAFFGVYISYAKSRQN